MGLPSSAARSMPRCVEPHLGPNGLVSTPPGRGFVMEIAAEGCSGVGEGSATGLGALKPTRPPNRSACASLGLARARARFAILRALILRPETSGPPTPTRLSRETTRGTRRSSPATMRCEVT